MMSRTRSTALERLVITLLEGGGGLHRFYWIPILALGPGMVHTFLSLMSVMLDDIAKRQSNI